MSIHSDDEVMTFGEFRRIFHLCPKGHRKGFLVADASCWSCRNNKRMDECPHQVSRHWNNPSNLPGDDRFVCNACGKGGLPQSALEPTP